jgi:putative transposase
VKERAKELGVHIVYLPPYSPDLNPIEFIWKSVKRVGLSFLPAADRRQSCGKSQVYLREV